MEDILSQPTILETIVSHLDLGSMIHLRQTNKQICQVVTTLYKSMDKYDSIRADKYRVYYFCKKALRKYIMLKLLNRVVKECTDEVKQLSEILPQTGIGGMLRSYSTEMVSKAYMHIFSYLMVNENKACSPKHSYLEGHGFQDFSKHQVCGYMGRKVYDMFQRVKATPTWYTAIVSDMKWNTLTMFVSDSIGHCYLDNLTKEDWPIHWTPLSKDD